VYKFSNFRPRFPSGHVARLCWSAHTSPFDPSKTQAICGSPHCPEVSSTAQEVSRSSPDSHSLFHFPAPINTIAPNPPDVTPNPPGVTPMSQQWREYLNTPEVPVVRDPTEAHPDEPQSKKSREHEYLFSPDPKGMCTMTPGQPPPIPNLLYPSNPMEIDS
jgi:hypothetical protein